MAKWHYQKNGTTHGPIDSAQLKQLAQSGGLGPDDLLRRDDMQNWTKASKVQGLFSVASGSTAVRAATPSQPMPPIVAPVAVNTEPTPHILQGVVGKQKRCRKCGKSLHEQAIVCVACGASQTQKKTSGISKLFHSWPMVAASLFICFPIGLFSVWTHPRWPVRTKTIWSGVWALFMIFLIASHASESKAVRETLTQGHQLWNEGNKPQAVAKYRSVIDKGVFQIDSGDRSLVFSRVVDHDVESGNSESAKAFIERGFREHVVIQPSTQKGKELLAEVETRIQEDATKKAEEKKKTGLSGLLLAIDEAQFGTKLNFNGIELYYKTPVNKAEAERLGKYLVAEGLADGEERSVQIQKTGKTYEFRIVIKKGMEQDKQFLRAMKELSVELSENVFDRAAVDIHLCDENLETIRVIVPL